MLRSEVINLVAARLGNRSGLDSQITSELVLAQVKLEKAPTLPWFLLTEDTSLTTVAATRTLATPAGFLREFEEIPLRLTDADGEEHQLVKQEYENLAEDSFLASTGCPTHYDLVGGFWQFFPKPDAAYSLRSFHYAADTTLEGGEDPENSWLEHAPDVMIGMTGVALAMYLRDPEGVKLFAGEFALAMQRMHNETTARREAAHLAQMGG